MRFHLLYLLVEDVGRFGDISVLDELIYGQFTFHVKKAYRGSSGRQETRMQVTVTPLKRLQRSGGLEIIIEVDTRS